jgi:hypothetical protein
VIAGTALPFFETITLIKAKKICNSWCVSICAYQTHVFYWLELNEMLNIKGSQKQTGMEISVLVLCLCNCYLTKWHAGTSQIMHNFKCFFSRFSVLPVLYMSSSINLWVRQLRGIGKQFCGCIGLILCCQHRAAGKKRFLSKQ